jgi:hypothetical protein
MGSGAVNDLPEGFVLEHPPLPDGFQLEGVKVADAPGSFNPTADSSPTEGNNFVQNLMPGIGQGITDAQVGIQQLLSHVPGLAAMAGNPALGMVPASAIDQVAKEKAVLDKPLLNTGGGQFGSLAGNAIATAPVAFIPGASGATTFAGKVGQAMIAPALQGLAAGSAQPVTSDDYAATKAGQMAMGAGSGAAVGGGLNAAGQLIEKALPQNVVGSALNAIAGKSKTSDFAKEGEDLAQRTGIDFTPGQVTGSKGQIALENRVRALASSSDIAHQADQRINQQWMDYTNRVIDNVGERGGTASDVGERVQGAVKSAVKNMTAARDATANADYGQIRTLLEGKPAIVPQNYMGKLQELGQEFAGGPEGSDYAKLSKTITSLQDTGLQNADIATMMKTRRFLSQVAGGQVQLAGDTGRGMQKRIASELLGSIDQDLDSSAAKIGGPVGEMLKNANAAYRTASQQIEGLQQSALGKLVGEDFANAIGSGTFNQIPGEVVMQRLSTLKPSQLKSAAAILAEHDPATLQAVKSSVLESALSKAQQAAPSDGANALAARPNVFVNALAKTPEDIQRMSALFSTSEQAQIQDAMNAARRISDKAGANFSGTASALQSYEWARALGSLAAGNPVPAVSMTGLSLSSKSVATVMANSQGRAVIRQMASLPVGSQRFRELMAKFSAIAGAQSVSGPAQAGDSSNAPAN